MKVVELQGSSQTLSEPLKAEIIQILNQGEVIAYPTDTLYGLGVDACSTPAIAKLYELKQRSNAPVSVLVETVDQLFEIASELTMKASELIQKFMPGALTVICKSEYPFAQQLYSTNGTVGFRIPADNISRNLPNLLGRPITTTSVNPAGLAPATNLAEIAGYFQDNITLTLDVGPLNPSRGSTVIDLTTHPFKILREGEISRHSLQEFIN